MRLGTLARKMGITPSKLMTYLETQEVDLSAGTNTKLSEKEIAQALIQFDVTIEPEPPVADEAESLDEILPEANEAPVEEDEAVVIQAVKEIPAEPILSAETDAPEPHEEKTPDSTKKKAEISDSFFEIALPHELEDRPEMKALPEIDTPTTTDEEPDQEPEVDQLEAAAEKSITPDIDPSIESEVERAAYDSSIEVIKPPKVKLPGLTVKGKIDLPEPKAPVAKEEPQPKERAFDPDEIITTTGPKRERRKKSRSNRDRKNDKNYNPLEEARKRKEREDKKRQEQEERRRKQAKAKHYKKIVNPPVLPATTKKKAKKASNLPKSNPKEPVASSNLLKRFWRWMNT